MVLWCRSLLLGLLLAAVQVHGQSPAIEGFISIDCGATSKSSDSITGIPYSTDDQFIDTGTNHNVASNFINSSIGKQYTTVRSFPDGDRNCYTLQPAIKGFKYLLRAGFMYGNYDGENSVRAKGGPLLFDLHIGVNLWRTVNISDTSYAFVYEAITVALADFVSVCLIRTNSSSTPFLSFLEMRQLKSALYPTATSDNYIVFYTRVNIGATVGNIIRYPDDPYDRIWKPWNITKGVLTTASKVENFQDDKFEVPSVVHQTAAVAANINHSMMGFYWNSERRSVGTYYYYVNLHFSELEVLSGKDVREFTVYLNNRTWEEHYRPPYLMSGYIYSTSQLSSYAQYNFSFIATKNATHPPLINAVEIYSLWSMKDVSMTRIGDVEAMLAIKEAYKVKKNWMGDPCFPKQYAWDGLSCSNGGNDSRILAVNLSSSGLVGNVSTFFSSLTAIKSLDLSYNNLTGKIPDSLADISSLNELNLTGNCITEIPDRLDKRSKDGSLKLSFDKCNGSTEKKKTITTPVIIVISAVPAILLLGVVVLIVWKIRRKTQAVNGEVVQPPPSEGWKLNVDRGSSQLPYVSHLSDVDHKDSQLPFESRQFMYTDLENITKNFSHTLGKGGFGTVFHGSLEDDTEVAVKMCSLSSERAPTMFLAEVENLSRVRHKNLVSLVGYCMDRGCLAVVYEYMPLGSLEDHLRGKAGISRALSWAERLRIVLDAAQGLDYLYNGCPTPIIHRDIKSSNILLGKNLESKVSDFGLSKAFHSDLQTHVSMTALAFSPGYVDPVCLQTWKFNEKTDVYSFGVVLLEIITGEPPIQRVGDVHIIERVQQSFGAGDINAIADARLQRMYNTDSVWKVAELAMNCTAKAINWRPNMAEVVTQLRESLEYETAGRRKNMTGQSSASNPDSTFTKESAIFSPSVR